MCLIFFSSLQKTVAWSAWLIWSRLGSSTSVYNFKNRRTSRWNPTIFTDEKPTANSIFFQAFLEEIKNERRRKTFLEYPPPTIIQKRTAVLMDLCLEKRSKQKEHDFHQLISPPTRIFAIFSRITIKKTVNKWRWLSVLKQEKNKKPVRKLQNTHFFFGLKNHHYRVSKHFLVIYFHAIFSLP